MYIREKHFKNKDGTTRSYLNLVESHKINGKVMQNNLMNFGRIGEAETVNKLKLTIEALLPLCKEYAVIEPANDINPKVSLQYGTVAIFKRLWEELGLSKVLKNVLGQLKTNYSVEDAIFNMVMNRLVEPVSKIRMTDFQDKMYGISKFEAENYYRAMDYLIEHKEEIEKGTYQQMKEYNGGKIDVALFDTTTVIYYGDDEEDENVSDDEKDKAIPQKGFSKAHRSDLKQVVIGVLMSKKGIPFGYEVFNGNKNDVTCFGEIIEKLKKKFEIDQVILIGDRGMISNKNVSDLDKISYKYILGFRMRTIEKWERKTILKLANLTEVKKDLFYKEVMYKDRKLYVCYNPDRAELDKKHRERMLAEIKLKIKGGSIHSIIDNTHYKRYLDIEGKAPKLSEEKIKTDALYDGVYVLTSNTGLKAPEIIQAYKDLWQVEHAFRTLKSELQVGPIFHHIDSRITAHVMICFFALILRVALKRKLRLYDKELSYTQVLSDLKKMHVVEMDVRDNIMHIRTELTEFAKAAFNAISMKIPAKVLYDEFKEKKKIALIVNN